MQEIETLEILSVAVQIEDSGKGFEAVTILLMQFMDAFGSNDDLVSATLPILEQLKSHIQAEEFEEAYPIVLAFLARFQSVNEGMGD